MNKGIPLSGTPIVIPKPCPRCGSTSLITAADPRAFGEWSIRCARCGKVGSRSNTREGAIKKWNNAQKS